MSTPEVVRVPDPLKPVRWPADATCMEASAVTRTVVRAVVTGDGDRVLLVRRSPGDRLGLHWELPGGRLGEDETVAEALARELEEETGLSLAGPPVLVGSAERVTPSGRLITEY